jgi:hypothetical protein
VLGELVAADVAALERMEEEVSEEELERALKAAGARKGATVEVGGEELELA